MVSRRRALGLGVLLLFASGCTRQPAPSNGGPAPEPLRSASAKALPSAPPESPAASAQVPEGKATFTIAFGSCNKPDLPQPLWKPIAELRPDAWAWLGDIVYGDTEDMARLRDLYRRQRERPDYAALAATTRVIGVWDDHDYGKNDAGREYPKRDESQAALLDFLDEPADSPRRRQRGAYASYEFGAGSRRVKVILLDGRYHRDPPGPEADTLGAEQWRWFEAELGSGAAVTVVVSSYQVLAQDHKNEGWAKLPKARERLFELIGRSGAPGVVLLSGDRHFAELSKLDDARIGYPLYELTSSGLTHSYTNVGNEPNRHRVGALYAKKNFGVVRVDFERVELVLEVRGEGGVVALEERILLSRLRRGS